MFQSIIKNLFNSKIKIGIVIVIILSIVLFVINGFKNYGVVRDAIKYLESNDYQCQKGKQLLDYTNVYTCTLKEGVKTHTFGLLGNKFGADFNVLYNYDDKSNSYYFATNYITHGAYVALHDASETIASENPKCVYDIRYEVSYQEETCHASDYECLNQNSLCYSYLPQVKESVTMFRNLYRNIDKDLKVVVSK